MDQPNSRFHGCDTVHEIGDKNHSSHISREFLHLCFIHKDFQASDDRKHVSISKCLYTQPASGHHGRLATRLLLG